MAKQIKAIKCPNCGSVQKTAIKPEHYHCDNCQTEYFLDNDDININVKHDNSSPIISILSTNTAVKIIVIVLALMIVGVFLVALLKPSPKPRTVNPPTYPQKNISATNNQITTPEEKI